MARIMAVKRSIFALILVALMALVVEAQSDTLVTTPLGQVQGSPIPGATVFRGIRYGRAFRWERAAIPGAWSPQVYDATQFGACCPQPGGGSGISEDCLFLNIYRPANTSATANLPVMVYIHGGGFLTGCSSDLIFRPDWIANSTKTVVVTLNYRLGVLGFLASNRYQGNFGITDQMLALAWVNKFISFFGGNPSQVSIFGQSAGGISVSVHVTSPISERTRFFQRAIIQSDPTALSFMTVQEQQEHADFFLALMGCPLNDANCPLTKSIDTIVGAQNLALVIPADGRQALYALPWQPVIDDLVVTGTPLALSRVGEFYDIPIIIGNDANETNGFLDMIFGAINSTDPLGVTYNQILYFLFGDFAAKVHQLYPVVNGSEWQLALAAMATDWLFWCPTREMAINMAANSSATIYLYSFNYLHSNDPQNQSPDCKNAACHGAELPFIFHTLGFYNIPYSDEQNRLSMAMMTQWTQFAAGNASPLWTPVNPTGAPNVNIYDLPQTQVVGDYRGDKCAFWSKWGYPLPFKGRWPLGGKRM